MMRRKANGLRSASPRQYQQGALIATRLCEFALYPWPILKKPALGKAIVAELIPAKANPTKSLTLSQGVDISGVDTRSPRRLADWPGDICAKCDVARKGEMRPRHTVGTPAGPRYGRAGKRDCNRGSGFPLGVTLTGGRIASKAGLREI